MPKRRPIKQRHLTAEQLRAIRKDSARGKIFLSRAQKLLMPLSKQKLKPEVREIVNRVQAKLNDIMILNHMIDLGAQLMEALQERKRGEGCRRNGMILSIKA